MPEEQYGQFTELLHRWMQGDEEALAALVPLVYKEPLRVELRARTQRCLARGNSGRKLQLVSGDQVGSQ
jgi:hypothetical protein